MILMMTSGRGSVYLDIARQRMSVLDMAGAKRYMEKALECFKEDEHYEGVIQCLLHLSDVFLYIGSYGEAEACSRAALENATEKGLRHYVPQCYNSLGMAKLISASDKAQGISYLMKSLDMLARDGATAVGTKRRA